MRADVFRSDSIHCGGWWAMCFAFPSCLSTCVVRSTEDVNLFRRCRHISAAKQFRFFSLSNEISLRIDDIWCVQCIHDSIARIHLFKEQSMRATGTCAAIVFSYHQHLITTSLWHVDDLCNFPTSEKWEEEEENKKQFAICHMHCTTLTVSLSCLWLFILLLATFSRVPHTIACKCK